MPHQEFYLAALDRQSCTAMEKLAMAPGEAVGIRLLFATEGDENEPEVFGGIFWQDISVAARYRPEPCGA
jgi:hypothetical protein